MQQLQRGVIETLPGVQGLPAARDEQPIHGSKPAAQLAGSRTISPENVGLTSEPTVAKPYERRNIWATLYVLSQQ